MSWALAVLAVGVATAVGLPWFAPRERRPTTAEAAIAAAVGCCLAGLLLLLARVAGADVATARLIVAVLMPLAALAVVLSRRSTVVPCGPTLRDPLAWVTALLAVLWLSPIVAGAWLMGGGAYPSAFFNVDSPFRLNHVFELVRGVGFPPQSIANAGIAARDHFGGPAAAAALALATGLPPHAAMFAVVVPVAALGVFGAAVLLADQLVDRRSRPLWLAGLCVVLFAWVLPVQAAFAALQASLSAGSVLPLRAMLGTVWRDPQSFNNYVEDITHSLGRALVLVVLTGAVAPGPRPLAAAAMAVVLLGQVKTGHVLLAGIVLAVGCAWHAWRMKRVWPLAVLVAAALGSMLLVRMGGVGSLFRLVVEPAWMLRHFADVALRDALTGAAVVAVPAMLCLAAPRRLIGSGLDQPLVRLGAVIVGVYGFFQVVGAYGVRFRWQLSGDTSEVPYRELLEPLLQMPIVFACVAVAFGAVLWPSAGRWRRLALVTCLGVLVGPAVAHRVRGAFLMVRTPLLAHEYADNRAIGEALGAIPVTGAVLATNDLRYPANNFGRDLLQFQLSAVRGHQAFALPGYERYDGWEQRVALQQALTRPDAAGEVLAALAGHGVTHLVIHKRMPHPDFTGWRPIFDAGDYAVYWLNTK